MRLHVLLASLAVATFAPVVLVTPATAAPCTTATRPVYGTVSGQDWRYVDVLIGFDFLDANGRNIDARPGSATFGCTGQPGYSLTVRLNRSLPATGAMSGGTKDWSVLAPANTKIAYIEVYPQNAGDGGTSEARYGHSLRRKLTIPYGKSVYIKMPLVCAVGGHTGKINGWVTKHGVRVKADRVAAWSMANDNNTANPVLGWNIGTSSTSGYSVVPNLPPGQYYTVQFHKDGVLKVVNNVYVNACKASYAGANF